jgi:hypothetical protein
LGGLTEGGGAHGVDWIREIRVIEDVEYIRPDEETDSLTQTKSSPQRKVCLLKRKTTHHVTPKASLPAKWWDHEGCTVEYPSARRRRIVEIKRHSGN